MEKIFLPINTETRDEEKKKKKRIKRKYLNTKDVLKDTGILNI